VLKLMLGIFKATQGSIFLDCESGRIPLDRSTRCLFAYVPQGNLLFSGTLRENLLVVKPDASQEELQRAVYVSAMDEYLESLPFGLDTVIGENGSGLSEGQSQRLSIARAILGDAPILLLDEATSALDAATEETVLERIRALPEKTCIAVTHRPAAVSLADWEIRIADQKIQCLCKDKG
jgi:ATP-binding cassette subfamily B protein